MTKPIYEILQNIMDNKKITVAETAKMCNLPDSTVRAIITRKQKSVALEVAFKLSQGLDVPLEVLNGESSDTNLPSKGIDPSIFAVKRKEMGLSPNDVSRRLIERGIDLDKNAVQMLEHGQRKIEAITFLHLCDIYGIDINKAFCNKIKESPEPTATDSGDEKEKDEIVKVLTEGLSRLGFLDKDGMISDSDFKFLRALVDLLFTHFKQGN